MLNARVAPIIVDATSTRHVEEQRKKDSKLVVGHVMVECYVDDKWILVDSTNGDVYLDVENITKAQEMYDEVFDLSLREDKERNKPTKNLLR